MPMPGEIKHTWVGTTLIVESDSGTSGANLKANKVQLVLVVLKVLLA